MKRIILILLPLVFLIGCKNENTDKDQKKHVETELHSTEETGELELNDGQKWYVNEEMKPFVKAGEEITRKYNEEEFRDYKTLAAQLKDKNNHLIKSCTMTGKSHDELHKWLHPHLELVEDLENTDSPDNADQIVERLEKSYHTYHNYFQ